MKRLRKRFGNGIRFFHCGEYGEKYGRPHYHAILFGIDFPDKEPWQNRNGFILYRSKILEEIWTCGYSSIGSVTFDSAAYVARYIMKKATGSLAVDKYFKGIDYETGEILLKKPEYTTMSRRPGIGKNWYDEFKGDAYPSDSIHMRGVSMKPPKFYDSLYQLESPEDFELLKSKRKASAKKNWFENTIPP